jgi:hypothetical protein
MKSYSQVSAFTFLIYFVRASERAFSWKINRTIN